MAVVSLPVLKETGPECGECTACCVHFPLLPDAEFWPDGKPTCQACKFLGDGCTIHDQPRPKVCTDFLCMWRQGTFGKSSADWRPDKSGLIVHLSYLLNLTQGGLTSGQQAGQLPLDWDDDDYGIGIVETRPRALLDTDVYALRYRLDKAKVADCLIVVTPYGFDSMYDKDCRIRFSPNRSLGVLWNKSPEYADELTQWWEGRPAKVAV